MTEGPWIDWETLEWLHEPQRLLTDPLNARLMGASPELLAALETVLPLARLKWGNDPTVNAAFERAETVIARSRGEA